MKKRLLIPAILPLVLLLVIPVSAALADCDPGAIGTPGNDTINCSGTTNFPIIGDVAISKGVEHAGDDTITNSGTANSGVIGDVVLFGTGGDDTITNTETGTVNYGIAGDAILIGRGGNDTITNNGTVNGVIAGDLIGLGRGGNDTITNNGTVNGLITGDIIALGKGGNDTITNTGSVEYGIHGDVIGIGKGGNDTITSSGNVQGHITGDIVLLGKGGNDVIVVSGNVEGGVHGDVLIAGYGGNDSVVIRDRATVQGIISGDTILYLGEGGNQDALHFDLKQREATAEEYLWFLKDIENADPASGYICWMGDCYTWVNFERLSWQLNYNFGPLPYYFMDIPDYELPVYGDGSAPYCTFYSAQHGPKWIDPAECEDFDPAQVDLICLNRVGQWDTTYVSGVGPTEDGKLYFTTIQHGVCAIFPKS